MPFRRRLRNHLWTLSDAMFRHPHWNIGVMAVPIHSFLDPDPSPEIRWFPPLPDGRYVADPFAISRKGDVWVLCEEYDYESGKGVIVSWELGDGITPKRLDVAIPLSVHASYPYLLESNGEIYCIPETHEAREIRLYQAVTLPNEWRKTATLVPAVPALDPTLFEHRGRWWLACTDYALGKHDRLFLWHSPDLRGPWEPHAGNPVKVDRGSARPGGTPFTYRNTLYRPAQDCSRVYGERIVINRINRLTPTEFEEERVATVEPDPDGPYPYGLHTISRVGDMTFIDGCRYALVPRAFQGALRDELSMIGRSLTPAPPIAE